MYNKDYDAAAVASTVMRQMARRGVMDLARIRTLYRSETFPTTAYGIASNLKAELARRIREAFFSFRWEESGLLKEFGGTEGEKFIPVRYKEDWEIVRRIDHALGVSYGSAAP